MDFANVTFLNDLLGFFEQHSIIGMLALKPYAWQLLCVLAIIDLCSAWSLYDGEMRISQMTSKVLKIGFFFFLIGYWDQINSAILRSFQYAGLTAAAVPINSTELIRPSGILDLGFQATVELFKDFQDTSLMSSGGFAKCFMDLISIILTLGAFFFIALQVLLTKIEFNIFASIGVILLPFGSLRYTSFLFQRVISSVFSFGTKLMVLFFLLGLFVSIAGDVKAISATTEFSTIIRITLSYVVLAYLVYQLPALVASMMNGQPSMDAGGALKAGMGVAAMAAGGVGGMVAKAASSYGGAKATLHAARTDSAAGKGSVAGNFAKNVARQAFANSTIGKNLIAGASHAINRKDDYENISSGKYSRTPQTNRNA